MSVLDDMIAVYDSHPNPDPTEFSKAMALLTYYIALRIGPGADEWLERTARVRNPITKEEAEYVKGKAGVLA